MTTGNRPLMFGRSETASYPYFLNGRLDEVSVYNRLLDGSEILAEFEAGAAGKCKPFCGNGVINSNLGEICDGLLLGGQSCATLGLGTGAPICAADCRSLDVSPCSGPATIRYVNAAQADDSGDGLSWATAKKTLQAALALSGSGGQIWVAAGTYLPDHGPGVTLGDELATFQLRGHVALYGGFAGGETMLSARDPVANVTILSGDLNGDDLPNFANYVDNSNHVVTGSGTDHSAVLDGFTIRAGNAPTSYGGGLYNSHGSPTVRNCIFTLNYASSGGGAIANISSSSPMISSCSILANKANQGAGGIINVTYSDATIEDCLIANNVGARGSGVKMFTSNSIIRRCRFEGNSGGPALGIESWQAVAVYDSQFVNNDGDTNSFGGAIWAEVVGLTKPIDFVRCDFVSNRVAGNSQGGAIYYNTCLLTLTNCRVVGNQAAEGGGIYGYTGSTLTLVGSLFSGNTALNGGGLSAGNKVTVINSTFSRNAATQHGMGGGGIYFRGGTLSIVNSVLWGNVDLPGDVEAQIYGTGTIQLAHSIVQGTVGGDPLFVDDDGVDNVVGTLDDDLRLQLGSPAIDAGDNAALPADTWDLDGDGNRSEALPTDLDGKQRISCATVDIGAYEHCRDANTDGACDPEIVTTGLSAHLLFGAMTETLEAYCGTPPTAWTVVAGALPSGLALSSDGVLAGTPTEAGEFAFTVRVTDALGGTDEKPFTMSVLLTLSPPTLQLKKVGTSAVPGRVMQYFIFLKNESPGEATDIHVAEFLENWFTLVSTDPPATSVEGENLIHWYIPVLAAGEFRVISYSVRLSSGTPLGQVVHGVASAGFGSWWSCFKESGGDCGLLSGFALSLCCLASVAGCPPCALCCMNEAAAGAAAACAIAAATLCGYESLSSDDKHTTRPADPNEKLVLASKFVRSDQILVYPIHFENVGNAEALDVFVTDVLDDDVDDASLEILTPGATYSAATRTLRWDLLGLNLQSGASDSVLYAVRPRQGLPSGTEIRNTATIQFEVFAPMTTNEVINIIDDLPPEGIMDPLPPTSPRWIHLSWTSTDLIGEIDEYTIFVSVDDGAFTSFLTTRQTSTIFNGEPNHTYGFICIAKDTAGNAEAQELVAETMTVTIDAEDTTPPVLALDPVTSPTDIPVQVITGTVSDPIINGVSSGVASVTVNDIPAALTGSTWSATVPLPTWGSNPIVVKATDNAFNQSTILSEIVVSNNWADCNQNGIPDWIDIQQQTSGDCNSNGVPDECEVPPICPTCQDCNTNNVPDACDIAACPPDQPGCDDCNSNGVPDGCDIAACAAGDPSCHDCNGNGVPDGCELVDHDCNSNGIPDACDIADCPPDQPACQDCNLNGVPDSCDIAACAVDDPSCHDCNGNGIPDECDLIAGISVDIDHNEIPDECIPPVSMGDPSGTNKVRFVSFSVPSALSTAIRIRFTSLHHVNPAYTGGTSTPFTLFEGQAMYVGPPTQYVESASSGIPFYASQLQCAPHYRDWTTVGLLHLAGEAIVPSSTYQVENLAASCAGNEASCTAVSAPLEIKTTRWGDVESPYNPPDANPQPDTSDISALVNKFKSALGAPIKPRSLLSGNSGDPPRGLIHVDRDVSFVDISLCVDAFKGLPYPYRPGMCTGNASKACISDSDCTAQSTTGPCILCP